MKKILKVIMTLVLICSCFYLAISLFMNHLIINDMVPTVVKSTAVTNALEDTCQNVLSMMNMDESQSQALVSSLQQDEKTQELVNEYIDTVLNNQSSTLDETLLKQVLEDKKNEVYSILNPSINEETFTTLYDQAINQMDLQGLQDKVLSRVENTMEQSGETYKIVKKVYSFKNSTHIIVSAILLVISTAYLIFISVQERLITKCLSVSYMVCGIMTFLISFTIILGLTAMASSTMTIQLTSIKYMYICGAGIFNYPSLMNADILLYDPDYVPVGEDQKQHCELARDIAERFNNRYSETFKLPEPLVPKVGGRIMDLQNPTKKMSKSDETGKGCIYILDDINVSKKKIMSAVTDSDNAIYYDVKNKPGISNLLTIYSILSGESIDALVERYQGVGYGQFKKDLAEVVGNELQKIHDKYNEINQGNYIDTILNEGADKARYMARKKLAKVERKIGITIKK